MEIGFLIISYTKNNFNNVNICLSSIRNFYPNTKIIIVDNFISGNSDIDFGENIYYHKNESNSYELGAIWHGVKQHPEVDRWITIHDSCKLINEIPVDINKSSNNDLFIPFWTEVPESYSPTMPILIDFVNGTKTTYEEIKNDYWKSVCGLMFISDSLILHKLIDLNFDTIKPARKIEAVCSESLLGLGITHITNGEMGALHKGPISTYISKQKPWEFIEKYKHGLGSATAGNSLISTNSKLHPNNLVGNKRFGAQDEAVRFVSNNIIKNEVILNEILRTGHNNLSFAGGYNSNLNMVLIYKIARHQAFTFKYFGIISYNKLYN